MVSPRSAARAASVLLVSVIVLAPSAPAFAAPLFEARGGCDASARSASAGSSALAYCEWVCEEGVFLDVYVAGGPFFPGVQGGVECGGVSLRCVGMGACASASVFPTLRAGRGACFGLVAPPVVPAEEVVVSASCRAWAAPCEGGSGECLPCKRGPLACAPEIVSDLGEVELPALEPWRLADDEARARPPAPGARLVSSVHVAFASGAPLGVACDGAGACVQVPVACAPPSGGRWACGV